MNKEQIIQLIDSAPAEWELEFPLAEFQKESAVDIVDKYLNHGQVNILLADEVGMGKTFIAGGVIRALYNDFLQNGGGNGQDSFGVYYFAPNQGLLSENIGKLNKASGSKKVCRVSSDRPAFMLEKGIEPGYSMFANSPGVFWGTKSDYGDERERRIIAKIADTLYGTKYPLGVLGIKLMLFKTAEINQFVSFSRIYSKEEEQRIRTGYKKEWENWLSDIQETSLREACTEKDFPNIKDAAETLQKGIEEILEIMGLKGQAAWEECILDSICNFTWDRKYNVIKQIESYEGRIGNVPIDDARRRLLIKYAVITLADSCFKMGMADRSELTKGVFRLLRGDVNASALKKSTPRVVIFDEFHKYYDDIKNNLEILKRFEPAPCFLFLSATPYQSELLEIEQEDDCQASNIASQRDDNGSFEDLGAVISFLKDEQIDLDLGGMKKAIVEMSFADSKEEFDRIWEAAVAKKNEIEAKVGSCMLRTERYMAYDFDRVIREEVFPYDAKKYAARFANEYHVLEKNHIKSNYAKYTPFTMSFAKDYEEVCKYDSEDHMCMNRNINTAQAAGLREMFWDESTDRLRGIHYRLDALLAHAMPEADQPEENATAPDISFAEKLLWIPPIKGDTKGVFQEAKEKGYTKTLVFCSYVMSTRAIAALLTKKVHDDAKAYVKAQGGNYEELCEELKRIIGEWDETDWKKTGVATEDKFFLQKLKEYFTTNIDVLILAEIKGKEDLIKYCREGCLREAIEEWEALKVEREEMYAALSYPRNYKVRDKKTKTAESDEEMGRINYFRRADTYENKVLCKGQINVGFAARLTEDISDSASHGSDYFQNILHAFQSPFYPFVMATTPTSQEGIDLHNYCSQIMHWNLPKSPVYFEQREGRVIRRRSHLVRRKAYEFAARSNRQELSWEEIFELVKTATSDRKCGIIPDWHVPLNADEKWLWEKNMVTKRIVVYEPYSTDYSRYVRLSQAVSNYRLSLGYGLEADCLIELQKKIEQFDKKKKVYDLLINLSPAFQ